MQAVIIKEKKAPQRQNRVVGYPLMDIKTINPFILAAVTVIKSATGLSVARDNIFLQKGKFTPSGTGMTLDLHGDVKGKIVYEFSKGVAVKISEKMIEYNLDPELTAVDFTTLLNSAILELGNQIAGKAITPLEKNGVNCQISPPKFYIGRDLQLIHPHLLTFVLSLKTEFGTFTINIALYPKE